VITHSALHLEGSEEEIFYVDHVDYWEGED
jgi:hypothetical protein